MDEQETCTRCYAILDDMEKHDGLCRGCVEQERYEEQREQWEREQQDDYYRRHPHG